MYNSVMKLVSLIPNFLSHSYLIYIPFTFSKKGVSIIVYISITHTFFAVEPIWF